ncbi:hypothetical protein F4802DRAFT_598163 [Xylaria palmicola]|nr:hypothetical protein F4802DRAFT_598163 [Xylaria palmicola]
MWLPEEIQLRIWEAVARQPRVIHFFGDPDYAPRTLRIDGLAFTQAPPLFFVNRAARAVALAVYRPYRVAIGETNEPPSVRVNLLAGRGDRLFAHTFGSSGVSEGIPLHHPTFLLPPDPEVCDRAVRWLEGLKKRREIRGDVAGLRRVIQNRFEVRVDVVMERLYVCGEEPSTPEVTT